MTGQSVESELRRELALYNATLEAAAEGILVTDADLRVTRFNQRLVDMWGIPEEVLASRDAREWVAWGQALCDEADLVDEFISVMAAGNVHVRAIRLKDGRVFERYSQSQCVDGQMAGRVWCYRDISERVRAEEERRRMESQMQHVQKLESLGVLAGGIAHDFNNLLVGILGHASLALGEVQTDSPAHERIQQIEIAAQRAAELTNQMLAYSGRGRFVLQQCDISALTGEMTDLLRTAAGRSARLDVELGGHLTFEGEPAQIRQVVMNLITNASDALDGRPGCIRVSTGTMHATAGDLADACVGADNPAGDYVYVEVSDNGCGMDAATLRRIFDPFFTTKFTGRGLGLAAVLGIVRGHRGAITIQTQPAKGTTFRVLLPASRSVVRMAVPSPAPAASAGCMTGRILVVDDESSVRKLACEVLMRAGFEAVAVSDGAEAVGLVGRDRKFDAVLLDMTMPTMSGLETFRRLRALQPGIRVVLTSGYNREDATGRFNEEGLAGFIQKPFLPSALVRVITRALEAPLGATA